MSYWGKEVALSELVGKKITAIEGLTKESEEVRIFTECGQEYLFYHYQDCCECVELNDFEISSKSLIGATILNAQEVDNEKTEKPHEHSESWSWVFYKIETNQGELWMRWLGESNGYYSESVNFVWANKPDGV